MTNITISEFFENDYVDYGSYDNLRKIASLVDGQKNASRKVLYTVLEKNIKDEIKVSQFGSKVSEFAEYLHADISGVITGMAENYVGANNIALLYPEGAFGTRFSPKASASRYIFSHGSDEFFELFRKEDTAVLKHQTFEGQPIEPMFYVPTLPMLLINGSEGVSSGFAQKILPRNPEDMKVYIRNTLDGKSTRKNCFIPWYKGFNGTIEQGETPAQWVIKGKFTREGINKLQITEVPIGYDLKGYIKVLDELEDRKVIQSYKDKSEEDNFLFDIRIASKDLKGWTDDMLLEKLKLVKRVTENYTVIDENNKIQVFNNAEEIMKAYIEIKKVYLDLRKANLIQKYTDEIEFDLSKYWFIKSIVDGKLKINNRKKTDIVEDLKIIPKILERDGTFDYLLNMAIHSLTAERMKKLEDDIKEKKAKLTELKAKSIETIWTDEI